MTAMYPLEALAWLGGPLQAEEQEWQERALCAQTDPEAFFPEKGGSTREAKRICQGCEVRSECLEYALARDERFGIYGGLSPQERRKLKPPSARPAVPVDRQPRQHYDRRAAVVQHMATEGWTIPQISDELGISGDIVRKALRRVVPESLGLAS